MINLELQIEQLGHLWKSTGEVMAIGRTFEEACLKAWASLEYGRPHPRPLTNNADRSDGDDRDSDTTTPLTTANIYGRMAQESQQTGG